MLGRPFFIFLLWSHTAVAYAVDDLDISNNKFGIIIAISVPIMLFLVLIWCSMPSLERYLLLRKNKNAVDLSSKEASDRILLPQSFYASRRKHGLLFRRGPPPPPGDWSGLSNGRKIIIPGSKTAKQRKLKLYSSILPQLH